MTNAYFYSNIAVPTTLSGNINNSVGSCTVADTTGWPSSYPYIIALDFNTANEELVRVTNNAAGTLTIVRGFGSTTAVSHSSGAAVRHVLNAVDFTDWRTHEQATSAAHGITGSFVGTTDAQVLTNKTLTAPTINNGTYATGGAMSGTFTGTPTFSGAVVLSGTPSISNGAALAGTFTGTPTVSGNLTFSGSPIFTGTAQFNAATSIIQFTKGNTAQVALATQVTADTFDRFRLFPDGQQEWGTGATTRDTVLVRSAAKTLTANNTFTAAPTDTTIDALGANLPSGSSGNLLNLKTNSVVQAQMDAGGIFQNYQNNTATSFSPSNPTGIGTATFTTKTGWYYRIGKMIYVSMHFVVNAAGSGASNVQPIMPTTVDGTTDVIMLTHFQSGSTRTGYSVKFMGSNSATLDRVRVQDGSTAGQVVNLTGANLTAASVLVIQGWYREN